MARDHDASGSIRVLVDIVVTAMAPGPTFPLEPPNDLSTIGLDQSPLQVRKYLRIVEAADKSSRGAA